MFNGKLTRSVFYTLMYQQYNSAGQVDARWVMGALSCSKATAISTMKMLEREGQVVITKSQWRTNVQKFFYHPSVRMTDDYLAKRFRSEYLFYMAQLWKM